MFIIIYIRDVIVDLDVFGISVVFWTDEDPTFVDETSCDVTVVIPKDVKEKLLLWIAWEVTIIIAVWTGDDLTVVIWFSVAVKVSVDVGDTTVVWSSGDVAAVPGFDGHIRAEVWTSGVVGSDDEIVAVSIEIQPILFMVL